MGLAITATSALPLIASQVIAVIINIILKVYRAYKFRGLDLGFSAYKFRGLDLGFSGSRNNSHVKPRSSIFAISRIEFSESPPSSLGQGCCLQDLQLSFIRNSTINTFPSASPKDLPDTRNISIFESAFSLLYGSIVGWKLNFFICPILFLIIDMVSKFGQFFSAICLENSNSERSKLDALDKSRK
jgi:hypothetical protein